MTCNYIDDLVLREDNFKTITTEQYMFKCPKCLSMDVYIRYMNKCRETGNQEYLACKCRRCEYTWEGETADNKKDNCSERNKN